LPRALRAGLGSANKADRFASAGASPDEARVLATTAAVLSGALGVFVIVGVAVIEIHVEDAQSLKAKRGVVRSISQRLRNRFNVSVGEVGGQGTWQRATLGVSMTGSDETGIRRALENAVGFVEDMHVAQVIACEVETLRMPLDEEGPLPIGEDEEQAWDQNLGGMNQGEG